LTLISDDALGLGDTAKLCQKMRDICVRRQRQANIAKKAHLSPFSWEKSIELVDDRQYLIDDLETVFPARQMVSKEAKSREQEASEMRNMKTLPDLQTIALAKGAFLAEAIANLPDNVRSLYQSVQSESLHVAAPSQVDFVH
jgi:hypothetical protein